LRILRRSRRSSGIPVRQRRVGRPQGDSGAPSPQLGLGLWLGLAVICRRSCHHARRKHRITEPTALPFRARSMTSASRRGKMARLMLGAVAMSVSRSHCGPWFGTSGSRRARKTGG
jgi:hypothetical protein